MLEVQHDKQDSVYAKLSVLSVQYSEIDSVPSTPSVGKVRDCEKGWFFLNGINFGYIAVCRRWCSWKTNYVECIML